MSLRLILIRHAKSDWGNPALRDHQRVLNDRGRRSATAIGGWLADRGYLPDLVLSSDAARTRETWALIQPELGVEPPVDWRPELYLAEANTLYQALRSVKGAKTVLMLAHNPGIAYFAQGIVAAPPDHARFADYPTAATLVADFDVPSWREVEPASGKSLDFTVPRDLIT